MLGHFEKRPSLLALIITIVLVLWLVSGQFAASEEGGSRLETEQADAEQLEENLNKVTVQTQLITASSIQRSLPLYGQSEPSRTLEIKAQTEGVIKSITLEPGAVVSQGQLLLEIEEADRSYKLEQAKALVKQRELEYQGAMSLQNKGFNAQARLAESFAQLASAKANLKQQELDLSYTKVKIPFDGVLHDTLVEIGEYVKSGQSLAMLVDNDPIIVRGDISENYVQQLKVGMNGEAEFPSGEVKTGVIRFIASAGDAKTRTFKLELAIDNPEQKIPAGLSSTLSIPLGEVLAHKVSPGLLSLGADGKPGLKVVQGKDTVRFKPIKIEKTESDGYWVSGLAKEEKLIIVGQGFVKDGQSVNATMS